ncbi:hypothetical protein [Desulfarculus baarsii]
MTGRRATLAALLALLPLCLAAPATAGQTQTRALGPARPLQAAQKLAVNLQDGPAFVVQTSQADGEAQLAQLAASAGLEEGWAFIPAENLWIEIGGQAGKTGRRTYHLLDDTVYHLMMQYDHLVIYHIHPKNSFAGETDGPFHKLQWTVAEALPSYADMAVMIDLSGFFRQHHQAGRLQWAIVSRHGVTTYGLSQRAAENAETVRLKQFAYRPLDKDDDAEMLQKNGALLRPEEGGPAVDAIIEQCARRLCSDQVWVSFRKVGAEVISSSEEN